VRSSNHGTSLGTVIPNGATIIPLLAQPWLWEVSNAGSLMRGDRRMLLGDEIGG
jgi:hypothetical protein